VKKGKVVDLPVPKPFQSSSGDSESVKIQGDNKSIDSIDTKMLIDTGYVDTGYIVPDQWGPSGPWSHNSHHSLSPSPMTLHHLQHSPSPSPMTLHPSQSYFQFPPPVYNDMSSNDNIKEEPCSPWKIPSLDLPLMTSTTSSSSPMVLSPAVSNLNTPRVSISSHGEPGQGPGSDIGARIRSSHSSLNSDIVSPVPGTFGHSVHQCLQSLPLFNDLNQNFCLDHDMGITAQEYHSAPNSRYSSPCNEYHDYYRPDPPSYEESLHLQHQHNQHQYKLEPLSSLPPPYPYTSSAAASTASAVSPPYHYTSPAMSTPAPALTPDPDLSEYGRDTPDSSIKEEPSEEASESGIITCRWRNCGKEFMREMHWWTTSRTIMKSTRRAVRSSPACGMGVPGE